MMRSGILAAFVLLLVLGSAGSYGQATEVRQFASAEHAARYQKLTYELRCLVCQNQNIADSNADLARDLRDKVYDKIMAGQSNEEILDYFVSRYGDFILYRPPFNMRTLALWVGPFLIVLLSLGLLVRYIRRRGRFQEQPLVLSDEQRRLATRLLATEITEN